MINETEIKEYSKNRGLENVNVVDDPKLGPILCGTGNNASGWPLVWDIASECGILHGIGDESYHQINPENFKPVSDHAHKFENARVYGNAWVDK